MKKGHRQVDREKVLLDGELVTKKEYCRRLNYNYNQIIHIKNKNGITFEQAVDKWLKSRVNWLEIDGKRVSRKEYCEYMGYNYNGICSMMCRYNLSFDKAIERYLETGRYKYLIDINGEKISRKDYCKKFGYNYTAICNIASKHKVSWEDAVLIYLNSNRHNALVELDGHLVSRSEYCNKLGYNYSAISSTMNKYNITFEEALQKHIDFNNKRKVKDFRLYRKWNSMKDRCYNPKNSSYKNYGGRGIKVCDRWLDYFNFEDDMLESFLTHIEQYGIKDTTIERDNPDGDYCPENCVKKKWATRKEQAQNRRSNIKFPCGKCLMELCEDNNLDYKLIVDRLHRGMSLLDAVTKKPKQIHKLSTGEKLIDYCRNNCIPDSGYQAILHRINKGMTVEEAIADWKIKKGK